MDKKDEESSSGGNPYRNIEKASVLQEVGFSPMKKNNKTKYFRSILFRLEHSMIHQ